MTQLLEFYRGLTNDSEGRRLVDILAWDDDAWESIHDYIQWLFPLPEVSRFNPDAPLLAPGDITAFQADPGLQGRLRRSFLRFLTFAGLAITDEGKIAEAPNFATRVADLWAFPNHNWLRISRVLRSLGLLGLRAEALAFHAWLKSIYQQKRFPIREDTFRYWEQAVQAR